MSHTGHIIVHAIALAPIHHGGMSKGNTSPIARQSVVLDDGSIDFVPVISGNSIRHMLRAAGARYALAQMGIPEHSLSKAVVNLLFSGGALGGKVDMTLAKAKRIAELFPVLSTLGYGAGSNLMQGRLEVGYMHLVCEQNRFMQPETLAELPHWQRRAGYYIDTVMGTRHDAERDAHASRYLALPAAAKGSDGDSDSQDSKRKKPKDPESTQMIYEHEVIIRGSHLFSRIVYRGLKDSELDALVSALEFACDGMHTDGGGIYRVGAKAGTGHGVMSWHFRGFKREIAMPALTPDSKALPVVVEGNAGARLRDYQEHLAKRRDEIMRELEEIAS